MAAIRTNRHGMLCIGFRYHGERHFLSTGLADTKPNAAKCRLKAKAIEYDISLNKLDVSKYFTNIQAKAGEGNTLADFFDYYIKEKNIRPSSWRQLYWAWDTHIKPCFGEMKLSDINRHEILVFRNGLIDKEFAPNTINMLMAHLAGMMTRAHEEGKIAVYPMKKLGLLDAQSDKIDPFSFDELHHFLDYLEKSHPEYYNIIYIWASCGFRVGEILALKWADVDLFNGTVGVNATLLNDGTEGPPKTKNSRRTIAIRPSVVDAYKRQEKRSRLSSEYVFPHPIIGKRYSMPAVFSRNFKRLLILAGLKLRSPNQLRHTFATLHIAAGENVTWVAQMMGHRNVSTTLARYNKFVPNLTRNDGSAFERAFSEPNVFELKEAANGGISK